MANFFRAPKAYDIVKDACIEQGLPPPQGSVLGSDDVTFQQMMSALSKLGLQLVQDWQWPQMTKSIDITVPSPVNPGDTSVIVDAPIDFDRFVDDTGWNTSSRWPMYGPVWEQGWQQFTQLVGVGTVFNIMWRQANATQIELKPVNAGQNLNLRYISRGWVRDDTDQTVYRDHVEKDSDHCIFDYLMLVLGVIYKFRERKGFDVTAEKRDYEYRRDTLLGQIKGALTLDLTRRNLNPQLIGVGNLPDTGYGS